MADIGMIAARREVALKKLNEQTAKIAAQLHIEPATIPVAGRDPAFLQMQQLEAQADFAERVAGALHRQETENASLVQQQIKEALDKHNAALSASPSTTSADSTPASKPSTRKRTQ